MGSGKYKALGELGGLVILGDGEAVLELLHRDKFTLRKPGLTSCGVSTGLEGAPENYAQEDLFNR